MTFPISLLKFIFIAKELREFYRYKAESKEVGGDECSEIFCALLQLMFDVVE